MTKKSNFLSLHQYVLILSAAGLLIGAPGCGSEGAVDGLENRDLDLAALEEFASEDLPHLEPSWSLACQELRAEGADALSAAFDWESIEADLFVYPIIGEFFGLERAETCEDALLVQNARSALLTARGITGGDEGDLQALSDDERERANIAFGAANVHHAGAVEVRLPNHLCSGVLISPVAMLTAAHCFNTYVGSTLGEEDTRFRQSVAINYFVNDRWRCVWGEPGDAGRSGGKCKSGRRLDGTILGSYNSVPGTDPVSLGINQNLALISRGSDLAVLVIPPGIRPSKWAGTNGSDYMRVWRDGSRVFDGKSVSIYGVGNASFEGGGVGTMRVGRFTSVFTEGSLMSMRVIRSRVCTGDSGGPVIFKGGPRFPEGGRFSYVIALGTRHLPGEAGFRCSGRGDSIMGVKLGNRIDWIESQIERVRGANYGCKRFRDPELGNRGYKKCWVGKRPWPQGDNTVEPRRFPPLALPPSSRPGRVVRSN